MWRLHSYSAAAGGRTAVEVNQQLSSGAQQHDASQGIAQGYRLRGPAPQLQGDHRLRRHRGLRRHRRRQLPVVVPPADTASAWQAAPARRGFKGFRFKVNPEGNSDFSCLQQPLLLVVTLARNSVPGPGRSSRSFCEAWSGQLWVPSCLAPRQRLGQHEVALPPGPPASAAR